MKVERVVFIDWKKDEKEIFLYDAVGDLAERDRKVAAALKAGKTIRWPDGREQFVDDFLVVEWGAYLWDKAGMKVAYDRMLVTKVEGEIVEKKKIRRVYKEW